MCKQGDYMCRGSEERKTVCLLDCPTARRLVWLDRREQGCRGPGELGVILRALGAPEQTCIGGGKGQVCSQVNLFSCWVKLSLDREDLRDWKRPGSESLWSQGSQDSSRRKAGLGQVSLDTAQIIHGAPGTKPSGVPAPWHLAL